MVEDDGTPAEVIIMNTYIVLYFLGLSFRKCVKAIQPFGEEGRSQVMYKLTGPCYRMHFSL